MELKYNSVVCCEIFAAVNQVRRCDRRRLKASSWHLVGPGASG